MKCIDCNYKTKGWFESKPDAYACIGTKEPFVINNLDVECTEYPEHRDISAITPKIKFANLAEPELAKAYVGDDGIYVTSRYDQRYHELLISRELFVEAYNKWIKGTENPFIGRDDADDWSED